MKNTVNLSTNGIYENITNGTFFRNGGNNIFIVESITPQSITLELYDGNGPTGSFRHMATSVFMDLYVRKNFIKIKFFKSIKSGRWMEKRQWEINGMIGAERYLIKQF